jgi:hypothetical protein
MVIVGSVLQHQERKIVKEMATSRTNRVLFILFAVMLPAVMLGLLELIAVSPIPMRGAEMFGMIANKIKGNPGATAYWTLLAGSMLWVLIGLIAALQEWHRSRRTIS